MSVNRRQVLDYTQKFTILSSRVNFAHFVQRRQLIQQGDAVQLNVFPPDNDQSYVPFLKEGEVNTTTAELESYLAAVRQTTTITPQQQVNVSPPDPPIGLSATPGNGFITISFTAGSDNGSPITDYLYSTDGITFNSTGSSTSPITIAGLTNGVSYTIELKAVNAGGSSIASASVSETPNGVLTTTQFTTVGISLWSAPVGTVSVDYLIVGGGGGSGGGFDTGGGGGGGGGMVLTGTYTVVPGTNYTVNVGDGGLGGISIRSPVSETNGSPGEQSSFDTLTALGGGGGYASRLTAGTASAGGNAVSGGSASTGGSGGGSAGDGNGAGGGGGGSSGNGAAGVSNTGGNGGTGTSNSLSGAAVTYGVGGRGANGNVTAGNTAVAGTPNTGNGARGGGTASGAQTNGAKGGSGIVILRYYA